MHQKTHFHKFRDNLSAIVRFDHLQFRLLLLLFGFSEFLFFCLNPAGRGYSTNVYTGRLRPEVQPLTLLYTISGRKGTPFVYPLSTNGTSFTYLL